MHPVTLFKWLCQADIDAGTTPETGGELAADRIPWRWVPGVDDPSPNCPGKFALDVLQDRGT